MDDLVDDAGDDRDGERRREAGEASQQRVADAVGAVAPGPQNRVLEGAGLHLAADFGDRLLVGGDDLLRQRREVEVGGPNSCAAGLIA